MVVTVTNANPMSTTTLAGDDWFQFAFDPPWGSTIKLAMGSKVVVNSPSGAMSPQGLHGDCRATR